MAPYKQMTAELLAEALIVARKVHERSYNPARTYFEISRESAAHATCEVLEIDPIWAEIIYHLEYLPSPRISEWTDKLRYRAFATND